MPLPSDRVTFAEASERSGVPEMTLRKWAARGFRGPDGICRRLQMYRAGGRVFTRVEWVDAFLAALNPEQELAATA